MDNNLIELCGAISRYLLQNRREETLTFILQGMNELTGKPSSRKAVAAYLFHPKQRTTLSAKQQVAATEYLLEWAEINFRTACDLYRYQLLRDAGIVASAGEYLALMEI